SIFRLDVGTVDEQTGRGESLKIRERVSLSIERRRKHAPQSTKKRTAAPSAERGHSRLGRNRQGHNPLPAIGSYARGGVFTQDAPSNHGRRSRASGAGCK